MTYPTDTQGGGTPEASRLATLELNASGHHYADQLDRCADLMVTNYEAFTRLPVVLQERVAIYADFRAACRSAVSEGAVADDRGPSEEDGGRLYG